MYYFYLQSLSPYSSINQSESSHKADVLGEELKEEHTTLKAMRAELQQVKEEFTDMKNEKEAIERVSAI